MSRIKMNVSEEQLMTAEQVLINPMNRSKSKQQFSFPKAQRFQRCKTQIQDYHFYNIPSTKSRIGTTIGTSKRTTFKDKQSFLPAPNNYNPTVEGQFSGVNTPQSKRSKGCIFALGRNQVKTNSFLNISHDGPNPTAYHPQSTKKLTKQYSFSKQQKFKSQHKIEFPNLGPGSYYVPASFQQSKQILSNQHKSPTPKLMEIRVDCRKIKTNQKIPPLYKPKMTSKGDILNMINKNRGVHIGNGKRSNIIASQGIPGPGRYKVFSQFLSKGKV